MIAISLPPPTFGDTRGGGIQISHEVIAAFHKLQQTMRVAAEKVAALFADIETKERELQRAAEAEFLAECKQGWHEPRRTAFFLPTHPSPFVPTVYQRRFRRHNRSPYQRS